MSNNTVQILERAREKVKQGWTQNAMARDGSGNAVSSRDDDAVSWCLSGACNVACFEIDGGFESIVELEHIIQLYIRRYSRNMGSVMNAISHYNDKVGRTQEDVVELLTKVIEDVHIKENYEIYRKNYKKRVKEDSNV